MQSVPDFLRKIDGGFVLDIRTHSEYAHGHICGALLIPTPYPPLTREEMAELHSRLNSFLWDYNPGSIAPIYVYCKKGIRAKMAVEYLKSLGYKRTEFIGGVEVEPLKSIIKKGGRVVYCYNDKN